MDVKKAAKAILEHINTAEKAAALKGAAREQYLKALDIIYGSVTERQKLTGHTKDAFHGSFEDIDKFKLEKDTGENFKGKGVYSTSSAEDASENYAKRSAENFKKRVDRAVELQKERNLSDKEAYNIADKEFTKGKDSGAIYPLKIRPEESYNPVKQGLDLENVDKSVEHFVNKNPSNIRSKYAAFDPRFKDSDLIMAANKKDKSIISKGLNALSIPQRILMRKTAQALGVEVPKETDDAGQDADAASEALTEKAAEKLGIEHPMAKAAIKTALDIGYDPLNLIGVGQVKKAAQVARKTAMLEKIMAKLGKSAPKLPSMAEREAAVLRQKMTDIAAQRKADVSRTAKRMESAGAAAGLPSTAEQAYALKKNKMEFEKLQKAKAGMDQETKDYLYKYAPELSEEDKIAQAAIDRKHAAEKEIQERVKAAGGVEPEKTEVIDDILNKVKKKK